MKNNVIKYVFISMLIGITIYTYMHSIYANFIQAFMILAIFKMPFMHKLTKSMAENTYVRSKGKNIVKTKIESNPSKTPAQKKQRLRMKVLVNLCKVFNTAIRMSFPESLATMSAWNGFTSANQSAIKVSDKLEVEIDFEALLVARGSLEVVEDVRIVKNIETHSLTVSHSGETYGYGMNEDDMLYIVVLEQEKMRSRVYPLNERQDEKPMTVNLPDSWALENLLAYVFVLSANRRKASNSIFVTME